MIVSDRFTKNLQFQCFPGFSVGSGRWKRDLDLGQGMLPNFQLVRGSPSYHQGKGCFSLEHLVFRVISNKATLPSFSLDVQHRKCHIEILKD